MSGEWPENAIAAPEGRRKISFYAWQMSLKGIIGLIGRLVKGEERIFCFFVKPVFDDPAGDHSKPLKDNAL